MKRILIFCVLGTLLSMAAAIVPPASAYSGDVLTVAMGMARSYFLPCLVIMAIACGVDWAMSGWGWQRIAACAAVAYAIVTVIELLSSGNPSFSFGLVSAIPAAACSWLSGLKIAR
jgi:hypothetical protein